MKPGRPFGDSDPLGLETDELPMLPPPRRPPRVGSDVHDDIHRYAIYRRGLLIGTSDLEVVVEAGSRAAGLFHPVPAFASVRPVFDLYHRAIDHGSDRLLREFVRRRDELQLGVWRGEQLDAKVELISELHPGRYVVHVTSSDERLWRWRFPDS